MPHTGPQPQKPHTVLIHIGKCGGSSLRQALLDSPRHVETITHVRQPPVAPYFCYYITLRCPIRRAISAFYWRRHLVLEEESQKDRFPGEAQILRRYGSLDRLARQLYRPDGSINPLAQGHFRSIHHLSEDIAFYLQNLLPRIQPEQIIGVARQEHLSADLERLFGIHNPQRINDNRHNIIAKDRQLSPKAEDNLRRFLKADYDCIKQLSDWHKVPQDYYQGVLSPLTAPPPAPK